MAGQIASRVAPRVHFYRFKLALITQLPESAVKPFGSFPQTKLFGSQAPSDPLCQHFELSLTIRYAEVIGKASNNRTQIRYDLFQIDWRVASGDSPYFVLKLSNLLALDPGVTRMDLNSEIVYARKTMDDMALLFIDGEEKSPFQIVPCHVKCIMCCAL